jgi:hypothetical protein
LPAARLALRTRLPRLRTSRRWRHARRGLCGSRPSGVGGRLRTEPVPATLVPLWSRSCLPRLCALRSRDISLRLSRARHPHRRRGTADLIAAAEPLPAGSHGLALRDTHLFPAQLRTRLPGRRGRPLGYRGVRANRSVPQVGAGTRSRCHLASHAPAVRFRLSTLARTGHGAALHHLTDLVGFR